MLELKPCTKFIKNSPSRQLWHIFSEFLEVLKAFVLWKITGNEKYHWEMVLESVDAQTAFATFQHIVTFHSTINTARRYVIAKNRARGYYDE